MIKNNTEIVTISISKYLSEDVGIKIAKSLWDLNSASRVRSQLYWFTTETDGFNVIAQNESGDFTGRVLCIQNADNPMLWYYGDLFVVEEYRRRHIAEKMLKTAFEVLKDKGCNTVCTYVDTDNTPSLELQKKLGFLEKPYKTFNNLIHENVIMFEKQLEEIYETVQVKDRTDVVIIANFYNTNLAALHGGKISRQEWYKSILNDDMTEENFLICRGIMPVAWLKINGLDNSDTGYISMLAVEPKYQRKGVGTYAVEFAERFLRDRGKKVICVQTTADNIAAVSLYEKYGFVETDRFKAVCDDGSELFKIKFSKNI